MSTQSIHSMFASSNIFYWFPFVFFFPFYMLEDCTSAKLVRNAQLRKIYIDKRMISTSVEIPSILFFPCF